MSGRFPGLAVPGPVSPVEWQALWSLNRVCVDMEQEWEAACTVTAGLGVKTDMIDNYTPSDPYRHHVAAIDAVYALALTSERRIGEIAWRYASAAVVLGAAVMDRLLDAQPALSPVLVEHLAGNEACLGDLREACDGTYARLISERGDDTSGTEAEMRNSLLGGIRSAYYNVTRTEVDGQHPTEEQADNLQLVSVSREDTDPLWEDLLTPVLNYAEALPFHIAHWVRRHGETALTDPDRHTEP